MRQKKRLLNTPCLIPAQKDQLKSQEMVNNFPETGFASVGALKVIPLKEDLMTLKSGADAGDTTIAAVLGIELDLRGETCLYQVIGPCIANMSFEYEVSDATSLHIDENSEHLIIPMNVPCGEDDYHWTLLNADLVKWHAVHMDSLRDNERFEYVEDIMGELLQASTSKEFSFEQGNCCQQKNRECRIHVIANAIAILRQQDLSSSFDAEAKRFK